MRILTFIHSFEPGGVEAVALRLIRAWRRDGIDAPLLAGRDDGLAQCAAASGIGFLQPRRPRFDIARCESLWMIAILPGVIRRLRPDVIFCPGNSYTVAAVAMKLLLGKRCPPIVAKISNDLDRYDYPWLVRRFYHLWLRIQGRLIDHFVAIDEMMVAEIAERIRPRQDTTSVIVGPTLSFAQLDGARRRDRQPAQTGGVRFVAVGRLVRQKNYPLMIEAFAEGARALDTLTIFGDGRDRTALEALIARLGLADRVILAGHIDDMIARLAAFDHFLLSSDFEGIPGVIVEALAAGLPISATDCCRGMRSLLRGGELGRLTPSGNRSAFAAAIAAAQTAVQDPHASLQQARRYGVEIAAPAYLAVFARFTRGSKNRPINCGIPEAAPSRLQQTVTRALHARVD